MRKPWYRESDGWWYVTVVDDAGRRHERLAQNKKKAFAEWHKREATPQAGDSDAIVASICDAFLSWSHDNQPAATFSWHMLYLQSFCKSFGRLPVTDLKPMHVTRWLDKARFKGGTKKLTTGARRGAITSLKRAFNWAVQEGYLSSNPVAKVGRPGTGRRTQLIDADVAREIAAATDAPFRLFLMALRLSGARPKEVRSVTAAHVDFENEIWRGVPNKTGDKTGLERTIYTGSGCLLTLSKILCHLRPAGPLFLNSRGEPWTDNAVRCRMARLRGTKADNRPRKTTRRFPSPTAIAPAGAVAYSFRHTYITECLERGIDASTVAALTGTSIEMIQRHYGHLTQRGDHLRAAARAAQAKCSPTGNAIP